MKVRFKENAYMNKINAKLWAESWKNLSIGYPNKEMLSHSICGLGTYYINKVIIVSPPASFRVLEQGYCLTDMYKMDTERRDKQLKLIHALQQFTKIAGRKIHLHQVTYLLLFEYFFLFSLITCTLALKIS